MILTSALLDTFDRCPRRFAFERDFETRSISTLGLLYAAVEGSMTAGDPCQGAWDAIMDRTSRLDVNVGDLSPLSAVRHIDCLAEVIALALRAKLGRAERLDLVRLGEHRWQSNLFNCGGELHRIILASHLDDDSLRSFAHGWATIGEMAALERSITLTVVLIGAQRGGRRHSAWSKGFQHPVQKSLRFAARDKSNGLVKGWKEVWREQTEIKPETWIDQMARDGVLGELIVSRKILYGAEDARMAQARREMISLIPQTMQASAADPMRRSSCDEVGRGACPFQPVCYSPQPVSPAEFPHLYCPRETPLAARAG
jgi:hypothetical protein